MFQILEEEKAPLKTMATKEDAFLDYYRWERRATLGWNTREFMVFLDNGIIKDGVVLQPGQVYVEEITGGHLSKIEDDSLWKALVYFAQSNGFTELQAPIMKQ